MPGEGTGQCRAGWAPGGGWKACFLRASLKIRTQRHLGHAAFRICPKFPYFASPIPGRIFGHALWSQRAGGGKAEVAFEGVSAYGAARGGNGQRRAGRIKPNQTKSNLRSGWRVPKLDTSPRFPPPPRLRQWVAVRGTRPTGGRCFRLRQGKTMPTYILNSNHNVVVCQVCGTYAPVL